MLFLTGDLGFGALEPLQTALGSRFINCGVAEQNMISVAAALCSEGFDPWVYTIGPFCYARALEQIRNDICLHGHGVKLLGNGGGFGYGVMGPSHHAPEDYGILQALPGMRVFIPAFASDIEDIVDKVAKLQSPGYIRLGRCELAESVVAPEYAPWRQILEGASGVMIVAGPLAASAWRVLQRVEHAFRPALWITSELPLEADAMPVRLVHELRETRRLVVVEEHVAHGSIGQAMCYWAVRAQLALCAFHHLFARGWPTDRYGSQQFHRRLSGLAELDILKAAATLLQM